MQRYRVECNYGSRYFPDLEKAGKYFLKCRARHLDVELWLVNYVLCVDEGEKSVLASQLLIDYSGTFIPKN